MLSSRPVALGMDTLYSTKTPGRMKGRIENAVPMTVHGKGKEAMMQTPFHGGKQVHQKAPMTTQAQGKTVMISKSNVRVLGDKTPFPNRSRIQQFETPGPRVSKFQIPSFLEPESLLQPNKTPDSLLRPSSARKQDRVPNKVFETPLNNGNHWDVSELSIVVPETEIQEVDEDDYDEIEYMPPNTLYLASEPALDFDLPDYKEVGRMLFNFTHACPYDDTPLTEIEIDEKDIQAPGWDLLPLRELESDDPFRQRAAPKSATASRQNSRSLTVKKAVTKPTAIPSQRTTAPKPPNSLRSTPSASTMRLRNTISAHPAPTALRMAPPRSGVASGMTTSRKPQAVDKANAATASRRTIASIKPSQIPQTRPTTSTATRSRTVGTAASTVARRPATSTSQYKTTLVSRPALNSAASSVIQKEQITTPIDAIFLDVQGGADFDDDFRFEV